MIRKPLAASVVHVWSEDPGLDRERPGFDAAWKAFLEDGKIEQLPVKDGARLARFTIGPLSMKAVTYIGLRPDDVRMWESVAYGLRGVADLEIEGAGPVELEFLDTPRGQRATDASLERATWYALLGELSARIWGITRIDP